MGAPPQPKKYKEDRAPDDADHHTDDEPDIRPGVTFL